MIQVPWWLAALLGGVVFGLSMPGTVVPLGEWLVLPGLAIWFAIALNNDRPLRRSYLFGCAYMAWFSWSVHHVLLPAYLAIVFVGGLYFVTGTAAVRAVPRAWRWGAFAVAVAGSFWMRSVMPDIHYPHGQPCHALWQWPVCMHIVTVGGEPLMNALLGLLAATGFEVCQSWRIAVPDWRPCLWRFGFAAGLTMAAIVIGHILVASVAPAAVPGAQARSVRIAAIEPGYHPEQFWQAGAQWRSVYQPLLEERLIQPTLNLLQGASPPDLVLWPESSLQERPLLASDIAAGRAALMVATWPKSPTRLVVGASVQSPEGIAPAALLVDLQDGRVLDHHDKQRLVPGGEFLPLVGMLPKSWADSMRRTFQEALGTPPDCLAGQPRPPLRTAGDVPFGALLCYDNAFPAPAAAQVAAGAEFLVVLSNEAWYRGGAELSQLVAMTVVRALENAVPIVRCTLDGESCAVAADGRVLAGLSIAPAPQPKARILKVSIQRAGGLIPPMAWLRGSCGWFFGLLTALGAAHSLGCWVRLRAARTALSAAVVPGPSGVGPGGS